MDTVLIDFINYSQDMQYVINNYEQVDFDNYAVRSTTPTGHPIQTHLPLKYIPKQYLKACVNQYYRLNFPLYEASQQIHNETPLVQTVLIPNIYWTSFTLYSFLTYEESENLLHHLNDASTGVKQIARNECLTEINKINPMVIKTPNIPDKLWYRLTIKNIYKGYLDVLEKSEK